MASDSDPGGARRLSVQAILGIGVASVVGVFLLWYAAGWCIYLAKPNKAEAGQLGDTFGAVNALFSGLAFSAVLTAILMQREDILLQRDENRRAEGDEQVRRREHAAILDRQEKLVEAQLTTAKLNAAYQLAALYQRERQNWTSRYYRQMQEILLAEVNADPTQRSKALFLGAIFLAQYVNSLEERWRSWVEDGLPERFSITYVDFWYEVARELSTFLRQPGIEQTAAIGHLRIAAGKAGELVRWTHESASPGPQNLEGVKIRADDVIRALHNAVLNSYSPG